MEKEKVEIKNILKKIRECKKIHTKFFVLYEKCIENDFYEIQKSRDTVMETVHEQITILRDELCELRGE